MRTLTLRELNRATLQRQLLLQRHTLTATEATERLMGLQAQLNNPPYLGLWTRLQHFQKDYLTQAMQMRQIVRAPLLRSTLHLLSADDYVRFRMTIQPALSKGFRSFFGTRMADLPLETVLEVANEALQTRALSTGDFKKVLLQVAPNADPDAMAYAVRTFIPLVQVPPGGFWGTGANADYALAETYLRRTLEPENIVGLLTRYLQAFGPASIKDLQFWVVIPKLQDSINAVQDQFVTYKDPKGTVLLDVPNMPIPDGDTPAPIRLIPEYDNLVIGHDQRARILPDEHYKKIFLSAARVRATMLVDGFVAGAWKTERVKKDLTLTLEPFFGVSQAIKEELINEAEDLVRFIDENAILHRVVWQPL
jgi:hypothetical protein